MKNPTDKEIQVTGTVQRITYYNKNNHYSVIKIISDGNEELTIIGYFPGICEGENIRIIGNWINDKKYGWQIKAKTHQILTPSTIIGLKKYLSSGMFKGVGKKYAEKIIDHFGDKTLEILEKYPGKLKK